MATEYVPALPPGYDYGLAKERNLLTGWGQDLPTLMLDEQSMQWVPLDPDNEPVHHALASSNC